MEHLLYIALLTAAGTLAGILVGAIPGLSATMAVAILVSLTYGWDVTSALAVIMGIYQGAVFGGSITACLINIPGAPSSITTLDGYPLAKRGEGGIAIGWACTESFLGGLIGIPGLVVTPLIARIAIGFAPQDYFLLAIFGILLVGSFAEGSFGKAMFLARHRHGPDRTGPDHRHAALDLRQRSAGRGVDHQFGDSRVVRVVRSPVPALSELLGTCDSESGPGSAYRSIFWSSTCR